MPQREMRPITALEGAMIPSSCVWIETFNYIPDLELNETEVSHIPHTIAARIHFNEDMK